jgi:PHD-finger
MAQNQSLTTHQGPIAANITPPAATNSVARTGDSSKAQHHSKMFHSDLDHPGARGLTLTAVVMTDSSTTTGAQSVHGESSGSGCVYKEDSGNDATSNEDLSDDDYSEDEEPTEAGPSQPRKHTTPAPLAIHTKRRRVSMDSTTSTLPDYHFCCPVCSWYGTFNRAKIGRVVPPLVGDGSSGEVDSQQKWPHKMSSYVAVRFSTWRNHYKDKHPAVKPHCYPPLIRKSSPKKQKQIPQEGFSPVATEAVEHAHNTRANEALRQGRHRNRLSTSTATKPQSVGAEAVENSRNTRKNEALRQGRQQGRMFTSRAARSLAAQSEQKGRIESGGTLENSPTLFENYDDIVCLVCSSGESPDADPIILCDGPGSGKDCAVAVHVTCYGASLDLSDEKSGWWCDRCAYVREGGEVADAKCRFCGKQDSALRSVANRLWEHPNCINTGLVGAVENLNDTRKNEALRQGRQRGRLLTSTATRPRDPPRAPVSVRMQSEVQPGLARDALSEAQIFVEALESANHDISAPLHALVTLTDKEDPDGSANACIVVQTIGYWRLLGCIDAKRDDSTIALDWFRLLRNIATKAELPKPTQNDLITKFVDLVFMVAEDYSDEPEVLAASWSFLKDLTDGSAFWQRRARRVALHHDGAMEQVLTSVQSFLEDDFDYLIQAACLLLTNLVSRGQNGFEEARKMLREAGCCGILGAVGDHFPPDSDVCKHVKKFFEEGEFWGS